LLCLRSGKSSGVVDPSWPLVGPYVVLYYSVKHCPVIAYSGFVIAQPRVLRSLCLYPNSSVHPADTLISISSTPAGSPRVRHSPDFLTFSDLLPVLFSLAGTIISPKFFRKIEYIDTLSQLASSVPITQIQIPAAVYTWVLLLCLRLITF